MAGPWEAYQATAPQPEPARPWEAYRSSSPEPEPAGPWTAYRSVAAQPEVHAAASEPEGGHSMLGAMGSGFAGSAVSGAGEMLAGVPRALAGAPLPQSELAIGTQPAPLRTPSGGPWEHYMGAVADAIDKGAAGLAEHFQVDPKFKDSIPVKTAQLVGGSAPIVVGALLGGIPGAAATAFGQAYESQFKQATKAGADPGTAHEAALADGLVNAGLMTVPAAQWLGRLAPEVKRPVLNAISDAVTHAGTMIGISQAQQLASNVISRETYAPETPLSAGLGQGMAEQGIAGALIPGAFGAGRAIRGALQPAATAAPELQQAAQGVQQAAEQMQPPQTTAEPPRQLPQAPVTPAGMPESTAMAELERLGGLPPDLAPVESKLPPQTPQQNGANGLRFRVPDRYAGMIADAAQRNGVPYQVLAWVAQHESSFNPEAIGKQTKAGRAKGMFQFMDATAQQFGIDPMDPAQAADGSARYLRQLFDKTGSWEGALQRYGTLSGEGAKLAPDLRRTLAEAGIEDRGAPAPATAARAEPETRPVFTNAGTRIDTRPELVELEHLLTSHDDEGRPNPDYPQELQPRDRSSAASQSQIRSGAADLQPERLMPTADASVGAPIVGPNNVVESGNGRVMMLRQAYGDEQLASRAQAYRQALEDAGYDTRGFISPALISRRLTEMNPQQLQSFTREANERTTLAMNAAEQGHADADRAAQAIQLWHGTDVGAAQNRDFVRSFMAQLPAEERGSMMLPDGGLSAEGQRRIQAAVVAHAYGYEVGPVVDRMLQGDTEGLKTVAGALSDAAGEWARMRDEAAQGRIPPEMDITSNLGEAVQTLARARQLGRPVSELVDQTDFDRPPMTPEAMALLGMMFRDPGMRQPTGRPALADKLIRYAQEAQRQVAGADIFGNQPPPPGAMLRAVARPEPAERQAALMSRRERSAAERAAGAGPVEAREARLRLYGAAQAMMRFLGLPPEVGLRFVDRLADAAGGAADGHYSNALLTLALDTPPAQLPAKLWHEAIHALMDPRLGLLNDAQRRALLAGADRWLAQGDNRARLVAMGYGGGELREEAVARMGEQALAAGMSPQSGIRRAYDRMTNFAAGVGQMLRGRGFTTADDVFRSLMQGERKSASNLQDASGLAGSAGGEEIGQFSRRDREQGNLPFATAPVRDANDFASRARQLPVVGNALANTAEHLADFGRTVQMMTTPMAAGTVEARATAKDFANAMRLARFEGSKLIDWLGKNFTPEQAKRMWEAADEESVARQQGQPTEGIGLSRLAPEERAAVEAMQNASQQAWAAARRLGMVDGDALPSYVPRMIVEFAEGLAKPVSSGAGGQGRSINRMGQNVRTSTPQMQAREHLTAGETEAAARTALENQNAGIARDIRSLPLATMRLQEALSGRALINKIKAAGQAAGDEFVREGGEPAQSEFKWFTIDNPAFRTWRPMLRENTEGRMEAVRDEAGNTVFEKVPVYVRGDFEGPLRAVLSKPQNAIYRGLMDLKGRMMTSIMYGVAHLGVIVGRAFPASPNIIRTMMEGNSAKNDPATMRRAILSGLAPIGRRFGFQDISSILNEPNIAPGRSWTAKLIGAVPGIFSKDAGDAVKRGIDRLGDFTHNTLLWDRVADIQMGLFTGFERHLLEKGVDAQSAARAAAHFANRYAGSLPNEAMSQGAREIANMALFSRSYRLGNIGAIKDMFVGLPRDIQSQIARDKGIQALAGVRGLAQRKAITTMAMDLALYYVGNSVVQSAVNLMTGQSDLGQEEAGYLRRLREETLAVASNPLRALNPFGVLQALTPLGDHEPGKESRILIGYEKDGTGIYLRNPLGKFAEDVTNYFTQPIQTLHSMLSPFMRAAVGTFENDQGFGRKIYDPNARSPGEIARAVGDVVSYAMMGATPQSAIKAGSKLVSGQGGAFEAAQIAGGGLGLSVSHGYPGGPALGEANLIGQKQRYEVQRAMPAIRQQIKDGDVDGARAAMTQLGVAPGLQRFYLQQALNPHSTRTQLRAVMRATPEEQARYERLQHRVP